MVPGIPSGATTVPVGPGIFLVGVFCFRMADFIFLVVIVACDACRVTLGFLLVQFVLGMFLNARNFSENGLGLIVMMVKNRGGGHFFLRQSRGKPGIVIPICGVNHFRRRRIRH